MTDDKATTAATASPTIEAVEPESAVETAIPTIEPIDEPKTKPPPTTALIVMGDAMFFQPSSEVLSVTLLHATARQDLPVCLSSAELGSLETVHIVMKASSVSLLYDPDSVSSLVPYLKERSSFINNSEGNNDDDEEEKVSQLTAHILEGQDDENVVETVRMSFVLAGLRLQTEKIGDDGKSWIITAVKD